jgi:hypothetical protein
MTIYNGSVPTVSYSVPGGSPHLQALAQTLQFTENELNLTKELQKLRLGIVANEQTLDTLRTWQQLGLGPISTPGYAACSAPPDSALKRALIPGLAQEATPAMAYELIHLWEQVQTELQAEQAKAVAAVRGAPPARQNVQPVAPAAGPVAVPQVRFSSQVVPQQLAMPLDPVAFQQLARSISCAASRSMGRSGVRSGLWAHEPGARRFKESTTEDGGAVGPCAIYP